MGEHPDAKVQLECVDGLILIAAFRYALGRMTYVVDHVATFVEANADKLRPETRSLIVREIDEAEGRQGLGMDFDARRWMRVRDRMLEPSLPAKEARP